MQEETMEATHPSQECQIDVRALAQEAFDGCPPEILWEKKSNYGHVFGMRNPRDQTDMVVKVPVPWMLNELTGKTRLEEAHRINALTLTYRNRLQGLGVIVPTTYDVLVTPSGFALHRMRFNGMDCDECLQKTMGADFVLSVIYKIVRTIEGILVGGAGEVGIDPRLSNFSLVEANQAVEYFDIFPPLIKLGETHHVHYPNPPAEIIPREVERKFTPLGIIRRLRFDVLSRDPDYEWIVLQTLEELSDKKLREKLKSDLLELVDVKMAKKPRAQWGAIIDSVAYSDVDTLREVAVRVVPNDIDPLERAQIMDKVFVLTSASITKNAAEHQGRISEFRELMTSYL